jgi:cytochrome c553
LRAPHALAALALIAARIAALIAALALALVPAPAAHAAAAAAFEDTLAQRLLACTGCHGKDGRAASDGYHPRIAGKPAGYLLRQLRAFRDGQRRYGLMGQLLAPLDDRYLREIAAHFAALDLPYAAPAPSRADAATLARGRQLAQRGDPARDVPACQDCHGQALTGVGDDLPGLLGLPVDYLNAQLGAWRTGARHADAPDCMAQIAQRLAANDVAALAHWLAAQPVPAAPRPASAPGPLPLRCGSAGAAP